MPARPAYSRGTAVRISFSATNTSRGRAILEHLVEERLVAGGTLVHAEAMHWLGGEVRKDDRKIVSAYTTLGKLPLIRGRLESLYGEEAPLLSQFVMTEEKQAVLGWIERNVRE